MPQHSNNTWFGQGVGPYSARMPLPNATRFMVVLAETRTMLEQSQFNLEAAQKHILVQDGVLNHMRNENIAQFGLFCEQLKAREAEYARNMEWYNTYIAQGNELVNASSGEDADETAFVLGDLQSEAAKELREAREEAPQEKMKALQDQEVEYNRQVSVLQEGQKQTVANLEEQLRVAREEAPKEKMKALQDQEVERKRVV